MEFNNLNEYMDYTINEIVGRNNINNINGIVDMNIIRENVTRCIFCNEAHNVRDCEDRRLLEFEVICTTIFHHVRDIHEFILCLYSFLHTDTFALRLKAFTIQKCGCSEYTTIDQCVNMLCLYMENTYTMGHQEGNEEVGTIREEITRMEGTGREIILDQDGLAFQFRRRNPYPIIEEQERSIKIRSQMMTTSLAEEEIKMCLCSICWEEKEQTKFVTYLCSHEFCGECVLNTLKTKTPRDELNCALCRGKVDLITLHSEEVYTSLEKYIEK